MGQRGVQPRLRDTATLLAQYFWEGIVALEGKQLYLKGGDCLLTQPVVVLPQL